MYRGGYWFCIVVGVVAICNELLIVFCEDEPRKQRLKYDKDTCD